MAPDWWIPPFPSQLWSLLTNMTPCKASSRKRIHPPGDPPLPPPSPPAQSPSSPWPKRYVGTSKTSTCRPATNDNTSFTHGEVHDQPSQPKKAIITSAPHAHKPTPAAHSTTSRHTSWLTPGYSHPLPHQPAKVESGLPRGGSSQNYHGPELVVCYNADGIASYQELDHYLVSHLSLVILMGDFIGHHRCWDSALPIHLTNPTGKALFQLILDTPHLTLLSPPGLPTCYHPHTGVLSVLDLFLGDPAFTATSITTGPYMGSDHLLLLPSIPSDSLSSLPGFLLKWKLLPAGWNWLERTLSHPPDFSLSCKGYKTCTSPPIKNGADPLLDDAHKADVMAFHFTEKI
ncbi:hypothetical protein O3P69_006463 [Scylla paramamosain]|uniref:Endonuclease/exonuclease/phosphatase domain-containing protein n=1 Tax=Scylla paramamosain TaxID=85552 RepID=A0AAW0U3J7_SCYPA